MSLTPNLPGRRIPTPLIPPGRRPAPSPWTTKSRTASSPSLFTAGRCLVEFGGTGVFVDVSSRLTAAPVRIRRGRATEFSDVTPAVLTMTLDNTDGALTPDNPSSSLYPHVVEDRQIIWQVFRGPTQYNRFWGWIRSIEPEFPTDSIYGATVNITAVDSLGILATYPSLSQWLAGARFYAGLSSAHWDGFVISGDGEATVQFDNVTDSPTGKATASIAPATLNVGSARFGTAEGLSMEGSVELSPASDAKGSRVRVDLASPARCLQFWLRLPSETQVSTTRPNLDILTYRDGTFAVLGFLRLTNNAGQQDLNLYNASNTFIGTLAFSCAEERWVRISYLTDTTTPTTTDVYYDGGGLAGGGFVGNIALDLRKVQSLWFGGSAVLVPKMELAGIVTLGVETAVPVELGLATGRLLNSNVGNRIGWLSDIAPITVFVYGNGDYSRGAVTGILHGKNLLEVGHEMSRTNNGFMWADASFSNALSFPGNLTYPPNPVITVDAELDLLGAPSLRRAVEARPTRIEVTFPAGKITVIDEAAEAAALGQVRSESISTMSINASDAAEIAGQRLARAGSGLRIASMSLDLESSITDITPALLDQQSQVHGLFPTQRLRVLVPQSHFGTAYKDVHVEGWTEIYDPVGGCRIDMDLSPALPDPAVADLAVAAWSAAFQPVGSSEATFVVPKPLATTTGDLLLAVHWTDNDGSLATMTLPGWTERGTLSATAGFGKVWTKTAGSAEPGEYVFGTDTDAAAHATIYRIVGADVADPIQVGPTWQSTASATSSHSAPTVTATDAGILICGWMIVTTIPTSETSWTLPGGMTAAGVTTQAAQYIQAISAYKAVGAGATGAQVATSSPASSSLGNGRVSLVVRSA